MVSASEKKRRDLRRQQRGQQAQQRREQPPPPPPPPPPQQPAGLGCSTATDAPAASKAAASPRVHGAGVGGAPQQQPPPPPSQQQQTMRPPAPPPPRQQKPHPAKNQGGGPAAPGPTNRSWIDGSPAFRAEADLVLHYDSEKEKVKACRLANTMVEKYKSSPLASHLAGRVQANAGNARQALKHFIKAAKLQLNSLDISFSLADLHSKMEHYGLAADECWRALAVDVPCDPALHAVPPLPVDHDTSAPAELLRIAIAKDRLRVVLARVKKLPRSVDTVSQFCSGLTELRRHEFLRVSVSDVLMHLRPREPHVTDSFQSALQFRKDYGTWQYWICPNCKNLYPSSDLFLSHINEKYAGGLQECLPYVPERIAGEDAEFLRSWSLVHAEKRGSDDVDAEKSVLSEVMKKLVHLNDIAALSSEVVNMPIQECTAPKKLSEIESFDAEDLHSLASRLQLIRQSPVVWPHEGRSTAEHDGCHVADSVTIDLEEDTICLSFSDEKSEPSNIDPHILFSWICKSLQEKSQVSMIQECTVTGTELLSDMKGLIDSLKGLVKLKQSLNDKAGDHFSQKASIDVDILRVTAGVDYVKKKLAKVCTFDYHKIIMPLLRAYLTDKLHCHIPQEGAHEVATRVCDDNIKSKDSRDEAIKQTIQALADFLDDRNNVLVKRIRIHGDPNDVVAAETTKLGRNLFLGFLLYVISQHRQNKSWNGSLAIDDLQVRDGNVFEISKKTTADATCESMANDLKKLAVLLLNYYRTAQGFFPGYFDQLRSDLMGCQKKLGSHSSDKTVKFHRYIEAHLALKSPMARGHLFLDLFRVRQALGWKGRKELREFLKRIELIEDWPQEARKHVMLKKVLGFGADESNTISLSGGPDHTNNLNHLLIYIRHATQHGPDHTKGGDGKQKLNNLIEVDLLIAKYLGESVINLIKALLDSNKMEGPMFEGVWAEFSNSRS